MRILVRLFIIYFLSVGAANAQFNGGTENLEANGQDLFSLIEDVKNMQGIQKDKSSSIPRAKNAEILDTFDLPVDFQGEAEEPKKVSTFVNYYKMLTGLELPIYGTSEFSQKQSDELLFFNIMDDQYQLAPGDLIRVTLYGLDNTDTLVSVERDGTIIIENLRPINAAGMTIENLEIFLNKLLTIDDASAFANVTLDTARLVTVQVSGDVLSPRTLAVPAYTPLSRVIAYAGGISDSGSLRNITLIGKGDVPTSIDFYDFLQNPVKYTDPIISHNSRLHIKSKGATLSVSGFVARPGIYELPEGQTSIEYTEVLKMAGSNFLLPVASIEILSIDETGSLKSRKVKRGDHISAGEGLHVRVVETANLSAISVKGAVYNDFTLPTNKPLPVYEVLKAGAVLKSSAMLDFAIISSRNTQPRAINLTAAMKNKDITIPAGATLTIYSQEQYNYLVTENSDAFIISLSDDGLKSNKTIAQATQMIFNLNKTPAVEVYVDEKRIAYLAPDTELGINSFFQILKNSGKSINSEFVIISDRLNKHKAYPINLKSQSKFTAKGNQIINLYSKKYIDEIITNYDNDEFDYPIIIKESGVASVYIDGYLKDLIVPEGYLNQNIKIKTYINDENIYNSYSIYTEYDESKQRKNSIPFSVKNYKNSIKLREFSRIDLFTNQFIREKLFAIQEQEESVTIDNYNSYELRNLNMQPNKGEIFTDQNTLNDIILAETSEKKSNEKKSNEKKSKRQIKSFVNLSHIPGIREMRDNSKVIFGAVYYPGRYPYVGNFSLRDLVIHAGGYTEDANLDSIELSIIANENGNLILQSRSKYTANELEALILKSSQFSSIRVNTLTNDVDIGTITLTGEVINPGKYRFSREETMHDIIERAGGYTNIAFPFGSIFTRKKIKEEESRNNQLLAKQLEQSIFSVAGTRNINPNASSQINALIGYSSRLKKLPVSGRMSVNVAMRDISSPIYLEHEDKLHIPKRPSHVSIIGAVGKETIGIYKPNKTVSDYYLEAGGLAKNANLKNSYILLPNGQSVPMNKNSIITPGSVIVIMPKVDKLNALALSDIVSRIMGNIATSILAINNVFD